LSGVLPAAAGYWDAYRGVLVVNPIEHYRQLKIPVLVILGEKDDRIMLEKHRPLYEAIAAGGVNLNLWVIPAASHGLMLGPRHSLGYPPGLHDRLVVG